jgi:hypothetical protein
MLRGREGERCRCKSGRRNRARARSRGSKSFCCEQRGSLRRKDLIKHKKSEQKTIKIKK